MADVKIKGTVVQATLNGLRGRLGQDGVARLLATLSSEQRAALEEPILITAWYPLDAYSALVETAVRVEDGGDPGPFAARAEQVVEAQLTGIYRQFTRLGTPESLVKRVAAAHRTYFVGSEVEVIEAAASHAKVRYRGFTSRHRLMEHAIAAFYRKGLELSGAPGAEVSFTVPISDVTSFAEVTIRWRAAASPAA